MQYLTMAFVAVWLLVTVYLVIIGSRQRKIEQELATLEEMLAEQQRISQATGDVTTNG